MAGVKAALRSVAPDRKTSLSTSRFRPGSRVTRSLQSPSVSVTSYRSSPGDQKPETRGDTSQTRGDTSETSPVMLYMLYIYI